MKNNWQNKRQSIQGLIFSTILDPEEDSNVWEFKGESNGKGKWVGKTVVF